MTKVLNGTFKGDVADVSAEDAVVSIGLFDDQHSGRDEIDGRFVWSG